MSLRLVADVGGTKTLLRLVADNDDTVIEKRLENQRFSEFKSLLKAFLDGNRTGEPISAACMAVAGPVNGRQAQLTNLDWCIDADEIAQQLGLSPTTVCLCNDFAALAAAIPQLADDQSVCLQTGEPDGAAPVAIIGAGTGLGQAYTVAGADNQRWGIATEGGHSDFAPVDTQQQQLLNIMLRDFAHVSYERLLSGAGLMRIYHFLADETEQSAELNTPAAISTAAMSDGDPLASRTLALFAKIYGAQAGNLALTVMARGGVYIAGGIAPQILPVLLEGPFMPAFLAKGRMESLMKTFPVHVITDPAVALDGASLLARQAMYNA